jgi:hypothetical protein
VMGVADRLVQSVLCRRTDNSATDLSLLASACAMLIIHNRRADLMRVLAILGCVAWIALDGASALAQTTVCANRSARGTRATSSAARSAPARSPNSAFSADDPAAGTRWPMGQHPR